jgi:alkylation response protein AidB-like acyl-CoA dehydrogenase
MDFDLTEDQKEIKSTARSLLAARSNWEKVRAAAEGGSYDPALWQELCELGWPGIAVAEQYGGGELGAVELGVLLEELGYSCAATPFLSTAVAAAAIQASGSDAQRAKWLPGLASGEQTAGLGTHALAADADSAAVIVLIGDDGTLELIDRAEADVTPVETVDPTRRTARVAGEGEPLGVDGAADRVYAAIAAEVVGVAQRALDMTLEYVKERKQFGMPVGAFQAVSHRCAEMLRHVESTRSTAYFAAWAADADPERLPEAAALAGASAADGGREATASAIQAHGGIGFTWEADVHWLYKRAQIDTALLGGGRRHRAALARIAAARLAQPAAA